ncbi:MAG TPA: DUF3460 family protein [Burkholderiales bacterium]|nr:DUF3460 family protein [Burkholderiales bacterium]
MKMTNYESEATRFIKDFLEKNPQVVEKQQRHRATWWDRPQNLEERRRLEQAKVPQKGYAYYNNP